MVSLDSLTAFLARYPAEELPDKPGQPRVIFPTAAVLTREQEDNMIADAEQRLQDIISDTGWEAVGAKNWSMLLTPADAADLSSPAFSFFGKRELALLMAEEKMEWRANFYGGLFAKSNHSLPMAAKLCRQMSSKAKNYFTGTEPWFSLIGLIGVDPGTAENLNRVAQWQFRLAKTVKALNHAFDQAFIKGEDIWKVTWANRTRYFRQFASVYATAQGTPITLPDGDFIYTDDVWTEDAANGIWLLVRPTMVQPFALTAQEYASMTVVQQPVFRERTVYSGLAVDNVYYKDVLVDPTAVSLEEARTVFHLYDTPATAIASKYLAHIARTGDSQDFPSVLRMLRTIHASGETHSGLSRPRGELAESSNDWLGTTASFASIPTANVRMAEGYLVGDYDGDGYEETMVLLMDRTTKLPIAYDYLDNVREDGKLPFGVTRINPPGNRWHGVGMIERFWPLQMGIDLMYNRINDASSREGSIIIVNRNAFPETEGDELLSLNGGETLSASPTEDIDKAIKVVYLNEHVRIETLVKLQEMLQQMIVSMAGVTGLQDAQMAGLPTVELATGIHKLDQEGQEVFAPLLTDLSEGAEELVHKAVVSILGNLADGVAMKFFEGEEWRYQVYKALLPAELDFDVEIRLTKYRAQQELAQNQASIEWLKDYAAQVQPIRNAAKPWYQRILDLVECKQGGNALAQLDNLPPILSQPGPSGNPAAVQPQERKPAPQV